MSTWRVQRGLRNGQMGYWISKPGIDVTTARHGEFLVDTSSQVYQAVANGFATLRANPPSAGSYNTVVQLPSEFAAFSDLFGWANLYTTYISSLTGQLITTDEYNYTGDCDLRFRVVGGSLNLTLIVARNFNGFNFYSNWCVFRKLIQ